MEVAQSVEHTLWERGVAGSSPVFCIIDKPPVGNPAGVFYVIIKIETNLFYIINREGGSYVIFQSRREMDGS